MMRTTTREQSLKLIDIGVSEETASYCWTFLSQKDGGVLHDITKQKMEEELALKLGEWKNSLLVVPAWTLEDLLEIAPTGDLHCYKKSVRTLYQYEATVSWIEVSHICQNPIDAVFDAVVQYYEKASK